MRTVHDGPVDWNLRTCARRSHLTYAPAEQSLRDRLHAHTPVGQAWRCLRCGAFVPGDPRNSGPAAEAPLVLRGRLLRQLFILRVLAAERAVRGILLIGIGYGILRFSNSAASLRQLFERDLPLATPLAEAFGYNLAQSPVVATIRNIFTVRPATLVWAGVAVLGYATLQLVEATGLWLNRRWGEYLTVVATSVFLPLEIYELTERVTSVRIGALIINVAAVIYLIVAKRLFGARGGTAAAQRERRSLSLLELEQAAGGPEPNEPRPRQFSDGSLG